MDKKRVVVFGATGHLGCYSALALKDAGYDVVAVGRRENDGGFFSQHGIKFVGGIVLQDSAWVNHAFLQDVDAVVHLAGTMPAHSGLDPMPYVSGIVEVSVNVLEWMRKVGCRRIVFNTTPSDVAALFGGETPILDDAPRSFPKNGNDHAVYAICKNAVVDLLEHYQIKFGFLPCVFRHFMVYGWHSSAIYNLDGMPHVLPYRLMIRKCIAGERLAVWGDPQVKRELLYVKDFADAVVKAVGSDVCGVFNLAGDKKYTVDEQIRTISEVFSPVPQQIEYAPEMPSAPQLLLSEFKTAKILGWKAKWSWRAACEDMKRYYKVNDFEPLWGKCDPADFIDGKVEGK